MPVISSTRGNPQFSDVASESALPVTGTASRTDGQTVLSTMDSMFGALYEDRSAKFVGGGSISLNSAGTTLTFGERLDFTYNNAGTQQTITSIVAASGTMSFTSNGNMAYIVLTKGAPGSASLTTNATALPAASSNQEVFLYAIRRDDISGTQRIYFSNGSSLSAGESSYPGDKNQFLDSLFVVDNSSDTTKQLAVSLSGAATSTKTTIAASQQANRTITLPDATDTLVGKATTDTLTNKSLTSAIISDQELFTETTAPSTPASGKLALYAKADHNLYIKNSSGTETAVTPALTNPMTTTGDMIYSSSGSTPARLAVGSAIQVITGGSVPAWTQMPANFLNSTSSPGTNQTLSSTSNPVQFLTPSANINVTLDNTFLAGQKVTIYNKSSSNNLSVLSNGANTIINILPNSMAEVICNTSTPTTAAHWDGVGTYSTEWVSFTLASSSGMTFSSQASYWRRVGDSMEIHSEFTISATGTGTVTWTIPGGYTINTSKIASKTVLGNIIGAGGLSHTWVGVDPSTSTSSFYQLTNASPVGDGGSGGFGAATTTLFLTGLPINGWTVNKG